MTAARALTVTDLAVARGGVLLLSGLGFSVVRGEALILRGPNGIGKTTVLRAVAGLQPPVAGRIGAAPESIAYAGHADGVKATLTVAENLAFWASVFGTGGTAGAIAAMDLGALVHRPAANLSAGQRRRLGLARLLVTGRPLWVLDEPTVSLDAASVALFGQAVARHLDAGGSVLAATHIDLGLAGARTLDLTPFRAGEGSGVAGGFDEAFG